MGASMLHGLAARGTTDVVLLEKGVPASGSTGRSQGILRMHYSNEVTSRMAWESLKVFKEFDELVGGPSGYVRAGYLLIAGADDRVALEENVAMQRRVGIPTDVFSAEQARDIAPALDVALDEVCAYEPESGYADPYTVTHSYIRRAQELGAGTRLNTAATGLELEGGRVTAVRTPQGTISTGVAVVAAGPWSRTFLSELGLDIPLETVRHQVIMFQRPEYLVPHRPVIGDIVNSFSARPDAAAMTLVAVGEEERASPDGYDHGVDMPVVEDVAARITARMPGMSQAVFRGGWSGLFTVTPDWHPILGRVEGIDGLYLAVGFSGHGFKLAPMVGVAMAETVLHGQASTIDISALRLDRFRDNQPLQSRYGMSVLA